MGLCPNMVSGKDLTSLAKRRLLLFIPLLLLLTGFLLYSGFSGSKNRPVTREDFAMGSLVVQRLYGKNAKLAEQQTIDAILQTENQGISWRVEGSDAANINAAAGSHPVAVSRSTYDLLQTLKKLSDDSGGAFNPVMGALTQLWNFDENARRVPSESEISEKLAFCDSQDLEFTADGQVYLRRSGNRLDLGAVGKGLGCDIASQMMTQNGCSGVVSVGGSVVVQGSKPNGEKWGVAVRDPFLKEENQIGILWLEKGFVSTSGDYEKYFVRDGVTYHHILDPANGYPSRSDIKSVTVVCDSGMLSDALSTVCFVLGYEKSLPLLEQYGAQGLFVFQDGTIRRTAGLDFQPTGGSHEEK